MTTASHAHLDDLRALAGEFVAGGLTAAEFDGRFRNLFSVLPLGLDDATFRMTERLFFACEDYVEDPSLRDPGDVDDEGLLAAAHRFLAESA